MVDLNLATMRGRLSVGKGTAGGTRGYINTSAMRGLGATINELLDSVEADQATELGAVAGATIDILPGVYDDDGLDEAINATYPVTLRFAPDVTAYVRHAGAVGIASFGTGAHRSKIVGGNFIFDTFVTAQVGVNIASVRDTGVEGATIELTSTSGAPASFANSMKALSIAGGLRCYAADMMIHPNAGFTPYDIGADISSGSPPVQGGSKTAGGAFHYLRGNYVGPKTTGYKGAGEGSSDPNMPSTRCYSLGRVRNVHRFRILDNEWVNLGSVANPIASGLDLECSNIINNGDAILGEILFAHNKIDGIAFATGNAYMTRFQNAVFLQLLGNQWGSSRGTLTGATDSMVYILWNGVKYPSSIPNLQNTTWRVQSVGNMLWEGASSAAHMMVLVGAQYVSIRDHFHRVRCQYPISLVEGTYQQVEISSFFEGSSTAVAPVALGTAALLPVPLSYGSGPKGGLVVRNSVVNEFSDARMVVRETYENGGKNAYWTGQPKRIVGHGLASLTDNTTGTVSPSWGLEAITNDYPPLRNHIATMAAVINHILAGNAFDAGMGVYNGLVLGVSPFTQFRAADLVGGNDTIHNIGSFTTPGNTYAPNVVLKLAIKLNQIMEWLGRGIPASGNVTALTNSTGQSGDDTIGAISTAATASQAAADILVKLNAIISTVTASMIQVAPGTTNTRLFEVP